jgi:hypothetical protein
LTEKVIDENIGLLGIEGKLLKILIEEKQHILDKKLF